MIVGICMLIFVVVYASRNQKKIEKQFQPHEESTIQEAPKTEVKTMQEISKDLDVLLNKATQLAQGLKPCEYLDKKSQVALLLAETTSQGNNTALATLYYSKTTAYGITYQNCVAKIANKN